MEQAPFDLKLAISLVAAFGILLIYTYQVGFFALIGFEYAGLTSTLDLWTNVALALPYGIATALIFFILLIIFQLSNQAGFDLARWIANHETLLSLVLLTICTTPLIVLSLLKKNPHLAFIAVIVYFVFLVAIVYCTIVSDNRIPIWSCIFAAIYLIAFTAGLGFYSAYYARMLEPRRFDIVLENDRIKLIRIVRSSSTGIIYAEGERGIVSFVNLAKVVRVVPSE